MVENNAVWKCSYVSTSVVDCEGNQMTLNGDRVTWAFATGTISQSGNNYDTINWDDGNPGWKKTGMYYMNIKYTFFTTVSKIFSI